MTFTCTRKPKHAPTHLLWFSGPKPAASPSTDPVPERQVWVPGSGRSACCPPAGTTGRGLHAVREERRASLPRWGPLGLEAESATREGGLHDGTMAAETQGHPNPGGPCAVLLLGAQRPDRGSRAATSKADKEL